jgi:hypothetical protein
MKDEIRRFLRRCTTVALLGVLQAIETAPFVMRVRLDDAEMARKLPAGSTGTAAIYTERMKPTHVVRRVLLRQVAILNYVNPF